jgi:hypothetical protein
MTTDDTRHDAIPRHGPVGRANLFSKCAECNRTITRIGRTGKVGGWRHLWPPEEPR